MTFFSSKVAGRLGSLDLLEIPTGRVACGQYAEESIVGYRCGFALTMNHCRVQIRLSPRKSLHH